MAPLPRLRAGEPLEPGQTTIFGTLNGGLSLARPPLPPRPGRAPKWSGQANTVLGRRLVGGYNEKQVVKLFATCRLIQSDTAEPGDTDIANSNVVVDEEENEDSDYKYLPRQRYAYLQEHKLAVIDYFQTTWRKNKNDTFERLSCRFAA
jgi:hypothetical protein